MIVDGDYQENRTQTEDVQMTFFWIQFINDETVSACTKSLSDSSKLLNLFQVLYKMRNQFRSQKPLSIFEKKRTSKKIIASF